MIEANVGFTNAEDIMLDAGKDRGRTLHLNAQVENPEPPQPGYSGSARPMAICRKEYSADSGGEKRNAIGLPSPSALKLMTAPTSPRFEIF